MGAVCSLLTRDDDDWVSRAVAFDKAYQEHQESFVIVDQPTIQPPPQVSLRLVPPSPPLSASQPLSKMASNPLISAQKSADSGLQVALHPLVLLTISDYITRHTLRQQEGPVVGALLGQQNGREITIEHAFECLLIEHGGDVILSQAWFEERLQQMKDVHKVPQLDLVGWYTIMPIDGPQPVHLPIHQQILDNYNESAILLGFHPTAVNEGTAGGKLPLTIYESKLETEGTADGDSGEDKEMKDGEAQQVLKFKELPYSVETGEAEMISVDFVARGGGNATAIDSKPQKPAPEGKGKQKEEAQVSGKDAGKIKESDYLTREEEELIATLTAKANAIKMLHARISLIATYLQNLPPSFISDTAVEGEESESKKYTPVNHSILRSIQALLTRLSLLVPADAAAFEKELLSEQNDVELVKLLSSLTQSIKDVRQTGRKFGVVREGKASKNSSNKHVWGGSAAPGSYEQGSGVMGVGDLMN